MAAKQITYNMHHIKINPRPLRRHLQRGIALKMI